MPDLDAIHAACLALAQRGVPIEDAELAAKFHDQRARYLERRYHEGNKVVIQRVRDQMALNQSLLEQEVPNGTR